MQGEFYWFELIQMAKKMILTGALVLIKSEEGLSNILVGVLVCLFYVVLLSNFKPYAEVDDNRLGKPEGICAFSSICLALVLANDVCISNTHTPEQVASVQLMVTLLMGMWLKLTAKESPTVSVILVLINVIVILCLLFTLMKTVLGMADVYATVKESVATAVQPIIEKGKPKLAKCQAFFRRGKEDAHAEKKEASIKGNKIIPEVNVPGPRAESSLPALRMVQGGTGNSELALA